MLRIHTTLENVTRVRLSFRYEIHCDARGELLARGATGHAFFDAQNRPRRVEHAVVDRLLAR